MVGPGVKSGNYKKEVLVSIGEKLSDDEFLASRMNYFVR
jgi:hypothetical protein